MQKVAFIVNPTRHLSSKLELYFRHQRRITMQSFGTTLKHSKHHACSFHSTAWVPPHPDRCQAVMTAMGTTMMKGTWFMLSRSSCRKNWHLHKYPPWQNEPDQVLCVRTAQGERPFLYAVMEEGTSGKQLRGDGVGAAPWRRCAFLQLRQKGGF